MIVGIEGGIGAGKTLVMTHFAKEEYSNMGKTIFSNYSLNQIPYEPIGFADLLKWSTSCAECAMKYTAGVCWKCGGRKFSKACILIDEAHVWVDSRSSASKLNRVFSYLMLQTGKEDINLYYTTQDFGQVEKRLRQRTDVGIRVKRRGDLHYLTIEDRTTDSQRPHKAVVYGPDVWEFFNTKEVVGYSDPSEVLKAQSWGEERKSKKHST